jgi:LacI family transcriptional regulator
VATIADVASLAGVSPMTVSRVVNGELNVRPGTREKVQAAIAQLNYLPNQAARRLAGSEPIRIGMLYIDPSAGYLNKFLIGLLNKTSLSHVQLIVQRADAAREGEEKPVTEMIANGIDGLILPPPFCDSQPLLKLIAETDTPAVVVSSGKPSEAAW